MTLAGTVIAVGSSSLYYILVFVAVCMPDEAIIWHFWLNPFLVIRNFDSVMNDWGLLLASGLIKNKMPSMFSSTELTTEEPYLHSDLLSSDWSSGESSQLTSSPSSESIPSCEPSLENLASHASLRTYPTADGMQEGQYTPAIFHSRLSSLGSASFDMELTYSPGGPQSRKSPLPYGL